MKDLAVLLLCIGILLFSDAAMASALSAAQVFVNGVMPALFPMMVFSRLLSAGQTSRGMGVLVKNTLFAFLSGSPASAQRVSCAQISPRLWEPLVCASGVMSPMFFLGTLSAWTGSAAMARRMLLVHWLGALLAALIWSALARSGPLAPPAQMEARSSLAGAIAQSARAMLAVLGAMMLFSILAAVLQKLLAGRISPRALAVLWALMEIGGGARAVIDAFSAPPWTLLTALCSFGGFSIWLQNLLFLDKRIRPAKLLLMRALHGAVSYGLMKIILLF